MSLHRVIIQGNLDFGTQRSFDQAKKMYEYRIENYCKMDAIYKESDDIFFADSLTLDIPRYVGQAFEKTFKNTVDLLEYCAQFALTGVVKCWQTESGKVLNYADIEPHSDKVAVKFFQKGKHLSKQRGQEEAAFDELTKAIEKYDKHAIAYERRGKVNLRLNKIHDAKRDYKKSIKLDPSNPLAYYGLAKVHIIEKDYKQAIDLLELTCKKSLALQAIYWKGRRLKADCHIVLGEWSKAEFDLKLFTKRDFKKDDPNYGWKRHAFFSYGKVLIELKKFKEAILAYTSALEVKDGIDNISEGDIHYGIGISKKLAGKPGFTNDFKIAEQLESELAKQNWKR